MIRKIGMLTSGGDAPGMNAAIASVTRCAAKYGIPLIGIRRGYNGLLGLSDVPGVDPLPPEDCHILEKDIFEMDVETVLDIEDQRGSYLRSARCDPFKDEAYRKQAVKNLKELEIDAMVIIGGDGSFHGAKGLCKLGIPCICIPGTIDNDLGYTEATLGYDTAVNVCVDAVRSIRATSRAMNRPHVVQVMGRYCGDIAMKTAMATGSEMVLIPEKDWDINEVADRLNKMIKAGNTRATLVITEHCWDHMKPYDWRTFLNENGHHVHPEEEMTAERLASIFKRKSGMYEVRSTVIGYTQRGAVPTAQDSAYAFEAGRMAVELLYAGKTNLCIGIRNGRVFSMKIDEALAQKKQPDLDMYEFINSLPIVPNA